MILTDLSFRTNLFLSDIPYAPLSVNLISYEFLTYKVQLGFEANLPPKPSGSRLNICNANPL